MALLVSNLTGAPVVLAAGNPVRTIPASAAPPNPGDPFNVTAELWPDPTVDAARGKAGGLVAADFVALQAQAASLFFEWSDEIAYQTGALVVSGPSPGLHAATHIPGAADALATAVVSDAQIGDVAAEGVAASFSRSDHTHGVASAAAGNAQIGDVAAEGAATTFSRTDHTHGVASAAPVAVGDANAEGVATSFSRTDHVHATGGTAGGDLTGSFPNPTVANAVLEPVNDAVADGDGLSTLAVIRVPFTAGGGGADDVVVYNANAPFKFRVLDSLVLVSTAGAGGSTAQLRDAAGGAGNALSMTFSTAAQGLVRDDGTGTTYATQVVTAGGTLALRRTDNTCAGEVIINIRRES